MILNQILESINVGLVILDRELKVRKWNHWMEIHSDIEAAAIHGTSIFNAFPSLKDNPTFRRSCKSVFAFGNFCTFSQKLHNYLFPFPTTSHFGSHFEYMQQSCSMGPLRDENSEIQYIFVLVQDVTEMAIYEEKLVEMNMKDGLTGIFNRRFMEVKLTEEYNRSKRYGSECSLIMFDIDHFKKVNDTYGHACGDSILKAVSSRIQSSIRNVDYLFRYGGEEFCCILPETPKHHAALVAERFRSSIQELEYEFEGNTISVTISLGLSAVSEEMESSEMLMKAADMALYQAKRDGRNRVVEADEACTPAPA